MTTTGAHPHSDYRCAALMRTASWCALAVLLAVAWWGRTHDARAWWGPLRCGYVNGLVEVGYAPVSPWPRGGYSWPRTPVLTRPYRDPTWRPQWMHARGAFMLWVPPWSVAMVLAIPHALAFARWTRARREAKRDLCPTCAYPRIGLCEGSPCPECGVRDDGAKRVSGKDVPPVRRECGTALAQICAILESWPARRERCSSAMPAATRPSPAACAMNWSATARRARSPRGTSPRVSRTRPRSSARCRRAASS